MTRRYILGIDVGIAAMGYAIGAVWMHGLEIVDAGVWTTKREAKRRQLHVGSDDARRIDELADHLFDLLVPDEDSAHGDLSLVAYELPGGAARGFRAAHALGMAHGLVRGVLRAQSHLPVVEVTARDVKAFVTGSPTASKDAMIDAASRYWPGIAALPSGQREHAADAIGVVRAAITTQVGRAALERRAA